MVNQPTARASTEGKSDFQVRRIQRRLDDLERTNATDIPAASFLVPTLLPGTPGTPTQTQTQTTTASTTTTMTPLSASLVGQNRKKQSGNIRRVLYAKKSLRDWLEELPSTPIPPYVSACAPPPVTPPRKLCSSCGYIGAYKCPRCGEWSCDRSCVEIHERDGGCGVGG